MGSLGWPAWILIFLSAAAGLLLLALHLLRFRYSLAYAFPAAAEARMEIAFLFWRKVLHPSADGDGEGDGGEPGGADGTGGAEGSGNGRTGGGSGDGSGGSGGGAGETGAARGPRPGQEGFLALPGRAGRERLRARLRSAGLKWSLDPRVWGHLAAYALESGWRTLRFLGPSLEHLHVGSADVLNLGRFAAAWSSLSAVIPFLACPVEYRFNERPFALRLRLSGGCTALGFVAFLLVLLFTLPWRRLAARFLSSWRDPRLAPWQRRLAAAA